jgi:hypothetical protein
MNKGQSSIEFITTYGYALLIAFASISILSSYVMVSPQEVLSAGCEFDEEFGCGDFYLSQGQLALQVTNKMPDEITIQSYSCSSDDSSHVNNSKIDLVQRDSFTIICNLNISSEDMERVDIAIRYTRGSQSFISSSEGKVVARNSFSGPENPVQNIGPSCPDTISFSDTSFSQTDVDYNSESKIISGFEGELNVSLRSDSHESAQIIVNSQPHSNWAMISQGDNLSLKLTPSQNTQIKAVLRISTCSNWNPSWTLRPSIEEDEPVEELGSICPDDMQGNGSFNNPCEITTVDHLQSMNQNLTVNYILKNDIDAKETLSWNSGEGFVPIGETFSTSFKGSFDGNNFVIENLYINRSSQSDIGLFGVISESIYTSQGPVIKDLTLKNLTVEGSDRVGSLAGKSEYNTWKTFENIGIINSKVKGANDVGGFIGYSEYDLLKNSFFSGSVEGQNNVGGLIGWSFTSADLTNVFAVANISGNNRVGGLTGYVLQEESENFFELENSYFSGIVKASSNKGALIGDINHNNITLNNLYFNLDFHGFQTSNATALFNSEMKKQSSFQGFDFSNTWSINEDASYPYFSSLEKPNFEKVVSSDCPQGFIYIPSNKYFSTSSFCIMKWEAKAYDTSSDQIVLEGGNLQSSDWADTSFVPISSPEGKPWVFISFNDNLEYNSVEACESQGWRVATNRQWMVVARDAENQSINWVDGVVGSNNSVGGGMIRGLATGGRGGISDGYNNNSGLSRRDFHLSTGDSIWDISGNVWEYVDLAENGQEFDANVCLSSYGWEEFDECNFNDPFSINNSSDRRYEMGASNSTYTSIQNIGSVHGVSSGTRTLRRSGSTLDGDYAGIYTSTRVSGSSAHYNVGFRCTHNPNY